MDQEEIFRFGSRIAEEMSRIGLKQKEFAGRLCVSDRTVRSWFADTTAPTLRDLRMMEGIGCDPWYIMSGERRPSDSESDPSLRVVNTAAQKAAKTIKSLDLSEADAVQLIWLAKRFAT